MEEKKNFLQISFVFIKFSSHHLVTQPFKPVTYKSYFRFHCSTSFFSSFQLFFISFFFTMPVLNCSISGYLAVLRMSISQVNCSISLYTILFWLSMFFIRSKYVYSSLHFNFFYLFSLK